MSDEPFVLRANDDPDGYGFHVMFLAPSGKNLLTAEGVGISGPTNGKIKFSLRSDRHDFEHDHLYLLWVEMFVGETIWFGTGCKMSGIFTSFLWRTEDQVTKDLESCPSGDGVYTPKGPMPDGDMKGWNGSPVPMMEGSALIRTIRKDTHG